MKLAAVLLLIWGAVHYLYKWAPPDLQGAVFNVTRSAASIVLVSCLLLAIPSKVAVVVGAGLMAEDAQVVGCGIWWLIDPWKPGDELCSERLGIPLGAIGLSLLGVTAYWLRGRYARPTS